MAYLGVPKRKTVLRMLNGTMEHHFRDACCCKHFPKGLPQTQQVCIAIATGWRRLRRLNARAKTCHMHEQLQRCIDKARVAQVSEAWKGILLYSVILFPVLVCNQQARNGKVQLQAVHV